MRVFVTGAGGFIGRAVVPELLNNGHQVLGLARSDATAETLMKMGAEVQRGELEDLESLRSGAKAADGVAHLAFLHEFSDFAKCCRVDREAITAMGEVLAGTGKPLVIASGTLGTPNGQLADEDTDPDRNAPLSDRAKSADLIQQLSKEKGIRGSVVRLTPTVHDAGDKGSIPMIAGIMKQKSAVTYVANGSARWPAVHRLDAAVLFRLALEKGRSGAIYNAVAEQGVPMRDIMTVVGKHLQLPVEGKSMDEVMGSIGFLAYMVGSDNPTSSEKTQKELGWKPNQIGLLEDLEANYFS